MNFSRFKNFLNRFSSILNWRSFSLKKLLYLPRVLNHQEKRFLLLLILVTVIAGSGFFIRMYLSLTHPVPGIGGTYTEGLLKEPHTINPIYAAQDTDRDLTKLIYSGLLTYNGQGVIEPDLAEKYEISEDGKIYTVFLKKNLEWHDGTPLTADDVVFTIKTIQNPQYKSVLRANWQGVTVKKIDDQTLTFTLHIPYTPFIENLTIGIIPQHLWETITPEQALIHELNLKPIGSGPFEFNGYKQAKDGNIIQYNLTRNPLYYRSGPYLAKVNFKIYGTEEEATVALHKNQIDGFGPLSRKKMMEFDKNQISLFSLSMPRIIGIFFNEKNNEALQDQKIRQAIAIAINKTEIAKSATSGGAVTADSPIPFLNFGNKNGTSYTYNPTEAENILENDDWVRDEENDNFRSKTTKKGKSITMVPLEIKLTTSDWPDLLRTSEMIKNDLEKIGIRVELEQKNFSDLERTIIRPRDFEMLLFGQVYGYESDPFSFWHSSQIKDPGLNISLYNNKKVDGILEDIRKTYDPRKKNEYLQELSETLAEDLPAIFVYSQLYSYLLPANIQGVDLAKISLPSDRFNEINNWYIDTNRAWGSKK